MAISIHGLAGALLFLIAGLAQVAFFRRGLAKSREGLPPSEAAEKARMHGVVLKGLLAVDVLVLPVLGYVLGQTVFE